MAKFPKVPIYLFYGNRTEEILRARDQVLDMLIEKESRFESLTEYQAQGQSYGIELNKILSDIAGDLSTLSFIPGAQKVVVVTNPMELYSAGAARPRKKKAKKKSASKGRTKAKPEKPKSDGQEYLRWIQDELKETGNHLILIALEDEGAGREVNDRHPIFQTIGRMGHFQKFRDTKAFWRIEDSLIGRNPQACLAAIQDLWKPGKGDSNVYGAVVRCLRFMLQANIGAQRAAELFYTAEWVDADKALQYGIVADVLPDVDLFAYALGKAEEIAQWPLTALREIKRTLRMHHLPAIDAAITAEQAAMARQVGSPDNVEAITAFLEKRPPEFRRR